MAGVGNWSATMIGISAQSPVLEEVNSAVDAGTVLIMAEAASDQEDADLKSTLESLHCKHSAAIQASGFINA